MFIKSELDYLEQEEVGEVTSISGIINQGRRTDERGPKASVYYFQKNSSSTVPSRYN